MTTDPTNSPGVAGNQGMRLPAEPALRDLQNITFLLDAVINDAFGGNMYRERLGRRLMEEGGDWLTRGRYMVDRLTYLRSFDADDPRTQNLGVELDRVLERNHGVWANGLPHGGGVEWWPRDFFLGLPESVTIEGMGGVRQLGTLASELVLRGLHCNNPDSEVLDAISGLSDLGSLKELSLNGGNASPDAIGRLLQSSALTHLESLYFHGSIVRSETLPAIMTSGTLPDLTHLAMSNPSLFLYGEIVNDKKSSLSRLTHLSVTNTRFGTLGALDFSRYLSENCLTHLKLCNARISDEAITCLFYNTRFDDLQQLSLENNQLGNEGFEGLMKSARLYGLERLDLRGNRITSRGLGELIGFPMGVVPPDLTHLWLGRNRIGRAGASCLARSPHLPCLQLLDLNGNRICDDGAFALANSTTLKALTHLCLAGNRIGFAGARSLVESPRLTALTHLGLAGNNLNAAEIKELEGLPGRRRLTCLHVGNGVGKAWDGCLDHKDHWWWFIL